MGEYLEPVPGNPSYPTDVLMDDTHILITRAQYDALPVYDCSVPTGVVPGKTWRRGGWIGRYDPHSATQCRMTFRRPLILENKERA